MTKAAAKNGSSEQSKATGMNVTVLDDAVEVSKSPVMSPSRSDSALEVFEDTDSDMSSAGCDQEDPWIEQIPTIEQDEIEREDSMDSTLAELTLDDLKQPPSNTQQQQQQRMSDSAVFNNSYQATFHHLDDDGPLGRSRSSLRQAHFSAGASLESPTNTPFRQGRRATAFGAIVPVGITHADDDHGPSLEAIAQQASAELEAEEEEQDMGPSFREFALLSWSTNKLSLLSDETMFVDDGPRHLDAFCLDSVDFMDVYPKEDSQECINPKALSRFCFPDGMRIRIIPRVCMPGAMTKKWAGVGGDSCHVLVFTDGAGKTQHGVAITIKQEVPLNMREKDDLRKIVRVRRRRRMAASRLCRWWRRLTQNRLLKEALVISQLEDHTIDELRNELSTAELKLLQENVRDAGRNEDSSRSAKMISLSSHVSQWQTKSSGALKKMIKSPQKMMANKEPFPSSPDASVASQKSKNHAEVESLTKNAIKRSNVATSSVDGDCGSEITDDTEPSEDSAENSVVKRNRLHKLAEKMAGIQTPPSSPKGKKSTRPVMPEQAPPPREISEWSREKGRESYQAMKHAAKHGNACIMEKCYVLVGCRPDEHVLLLGPLQQLVNAERKEVNECRANSQGLPMDEYVEKERTLLETQRARRHLTIEAMLDNLRLTQGQAAITFPRTHLEYIVGGKHYFQTTLPIPHANPIKLPLPLPSIGKQWGLSRLLMDIGPDSLVLMLKLLLMERSILVLGENLEDVTACACSLLELLEPFEWSSVFLPVLPHNMLDFVMSPVPFVAGMAVSDYARVCDVEKDSRTLEAMDHGMSLLNLSTKTLHITSEAGISKMLSLDPYLREQLRCIHGRLQFLLQNPSSSLHSFQRFVRNGFSPKESVTLDSACMALENHFSRYCGDLAVDCTAWKQYGTIHVETGKFSFQPDWFMNRLRADQVFHEAMVNTQLFMGYVDERRRDQLEVVEMRRGEVGKFIAEWIYERWLIWKERNSPVEV